VALTFIAFFVWKKRGREKMKVGKSERERKGAGGGR
jgi:hypothetical protein